MSKKYKLLKDLPNAKAGAVYKITDSGTDYICYDLMGKRSWDVSYPREYIENNPEWFELINDRIEVKDFFFECHNKYNGGDYVVVLNSIIPEDKKQLIKQAIERVLNGDDECVFDIEKINAQVDKLQAMEYAFNAARKKNYLAGLNPNPR